MYRPIVLVTLFFAAVATLIPSPRADAQQAKTTPVREVAPEGTEPYSTIFSGSFTSGNGGDIVSPDPIPLNRRLVIEFVSVRVIVAPGEKPRFALEDLIAGASKPYILPTTLATTGAFGEEYRVTQLVKLYHDGNGANGPEADCAREQNTFNTISCTVVISGYLIPR